MCNIAYTLPRWTYKSEDLNEITQYVPFSKIYTVEDQLSGWTEKLQGTLQSRTSLKERNVMVAVWQSAARTDSLQLSKSQ